jgi:hypothetical protein
MTSTSSLFQLSLTLQVAIGSGYLAYLISYAGLRQHHTAADAILRSFAFGVVANVAMQYLPLVKPVAVAVAFLMTIFCGVIWRWLLMHRWRNLMRILGVSWSDDIPTAWLSLTATSTGWAPSQVLVETLDGRMLFCDDTRLFKDAHEGPVVFGLQGDIALYVTAERRSDGEWFDKNDVRHTSEGDLITYVPASQIKRVEVRYLSATASKEMPAAAMVAEAKA